MMTVIILHMAVLRVSAKVSFVCQHLAGCHTSAEENLNGTTTNMSPLHSPQGICLPKCLRKFLSHLKAWRQNSENMPPRLGKHKLRVTAG